MRYALISDIHANLPALRAVLADIESRPGIDATFHLGDLHVPSATFFDLGVFAVVVGAILLILTALAHQSIRGHRPAARSTAAPENPEAY